MKQAAAEQLTPSDHFVEINGLRLHYVQWDSEARERTILLLHGGAANTHWWDAVAPQLTAHGRVIALDFRGHGRSQWERPAHYGPPAYVDDVRKFIEQIGSPVVLVGHSMGGAVAQWTASLYPQLIAALVIIDAPHGSPPLWRRLMWRWRRRARGGGRPELDSAAAIVGRFRLVPPQTYLSRAAIERLAIDCAEQLPNGKWAFRFDPETRAWRRMVGSSLSRPKLRLITAPTLILRGADSTLISPHAMRAMQRRIRGSIVGEIPRAFHHVPLDNPDETAASIAMLIETLAPRRN
ncbi:MAG: alpha/beta hydrolase [Candidatus Binataceae bacterium]|nr:alpha/beta hydrolase [Candidatus Binataceae bacterium]